MPSVEIDVNDFYSVLMDMAAQVVDEDEEQLSADVYALGDRARDNLKAAVGKWSQTEDLPERERLLYERGWKSYHYKPVEGHVEAVVANATAPSLTHLIEKGHELFVYGEDTGRRTQARPHIREAYEAAAATFDGSVA